MAGPSSPSRKPFGEKSQPSFTYSSPRALRSSRLSLLAAVLAFCVTVFIWLSLKWPKGKNWIGGDKKSKRHSRVAGMHIRDMLGVKISFTPYPKRGSMMSPKALGWIIQNLDDGWIENLTVSKIKMPTLSRRPFAFWVTYSRPIICPLHYQLYLLIETIFTLTKALISLIDFLELMIHLPVSLTPASIQPPAKESDPTLTVEEALVRITKHLMIPTKHGNLNIVAELPSGIGGRLSPKMDHLVRFLPGSIALGATGGLTEAEARRLPSWTTKKAQQMKLARELTSVPNIKEDIRQEVYKDVA
ncbi:hypothetical protein BCR34DRAFT_599035 [Clohesyomyces aquaticus]|uniref:mannosyl-oligosaccharide 1,2-alpha-mannosidase n=1 Tax=Clohesyomyces aquaticus TaxID=1231657 RepID=A0A1Y1ZWV5_9PLEO|nr:hypothetical protein BCR34DRAFT_599035 [Clohesyomyces aquaticus]